MDLGLKGKKAIITGGSNFWVKIGKYTSRWGQDRPDYYTGYLGLLRDA